MKTIKTVGALMGASTLLVATGAFAALPPQLYITAPGYTPDQAGPYTVQLIGSTAGIGPIYTGTAAPAINTGIGATVAFQTFCIASTVDYTPNNYYYYQNSIGVQPFAGEVPAPGPESYVTWGTAYLYNDFLHNEGNATFGGTGNNIANDALQEAIWTLQGQSLSGITLSSAAQANPSTLASDLSADLLLAKTEATAFGISSDTNNANGAFGVEALNMSSSSTLANGDWVQPQLVELGNGSQGSTVPEPSTVFAGALMLLPLGISAVRIMRKNRVS